MQDMIFIHNVRVCEHSTSVCGCVRGSVCVCVGGWKNQNFTLGYTFLKAAQSYSKRERDEESSLLERGTRAKGRRVEGWDG